MRWTIPTYILAAFAEIGGCFAFWAWLRLEKSPWWLLPGMASLALFAWALSRIDADFAGRAYAANVGDFGAADALVQQIVTGRGAIDGLFHSAGTSLVMPMRLTKQAQIDDLFGAAVMGALGMAKALSRRNAMNDGGSLVLMSSVSAVRGRRGMVAYSAAKAATSGMVRALAVELAERRIRVNSITAGAVETAMHRRFVESVSEDLVAGYRDLHPLGFGQPDDVASAVAFLLSDASRWITGIDLPVDGGYAAK